MSEEQIAAFFEKPVFLHAINRELHTAVGQKVLPDELLHSIRLFTLISSQRLFCNISQIQAIFYDNPDALAEISGLIGIGQFLAHSDYGSMPEYLESRNEKFKHAQQNHPEFFSKQHNQLLDIPLDTMGKSVETTGFIEAGLNEFVESKKSLLSDTLETNDAKMLQSSEEWLIETLERVAFNQFHSLRP